jgi:hypothetical protein
MSIEDWRFLINYLVCKKKVVPTMHTSRVLVLQCRNGASLQAPFQDEAVAVFVSWWQIYSVETLFPTTTTSTTMLAFTCSPVVAEHLGGKLDQVENLMRREPGRDDEFVERSVLLHSINVWSSIALVSRD